MEERKIYVGDITDDVEYMFLEQFFIMRTNLVKDQIVIENLKRHAQHPTKWAFIKVKNNNDAFDKIMHDYRYPEIKNNVKSRVLEFNPKIKTMDLTKTNVFVKGLRQEIKHNDLHEYFQKNFGPIQSAKVSISIVKDDKA